MPIKLTEIKKRHTNKRGSDVCRRSINKLINQTREEKNRLKLLYFLIDQKKGAHHCHGNSSFFLSFLETLCFNNVFPLKLLLFFFAFHFKHESSSNSLKYIFSFLG